MLFAICGAIGVATLLSMRILCRYFNDLQLVLGGVAFMTVTCTILAGSPVGATGLYIFLFAVFLFYSVGFPVGHTAVSYDGRHRDARGKGGGADGGSMIIYEVSHCAVFKHQQPYHYVLV